jgi:CBS domain-containing protein
MVTSGSGHLEGIVTKTDILEALKTSGGDELEPAAPG